MNNQTVKPELKSPEMKAKYLSLYNFSSKIEYTDPAGDTETGKLCGISRVMFPGKTYFASVYWNGSKLDIDLSKEYCSALLTPLDQITDEDAVAVDFVSASHFNKVMESYGDEFIDLLLKHHQVDYLRLHGYAVDWNGHSVEELIAAGYMKLREGGSNG